jgi:hypothetical protein
VHQQIPNPVLDRAVVLRPSEGRPCTNCAGFPEGWSEEAQVGVYTLCETHETQSRVMAAIGMVVGHQVVRLARHLGRSLTR